MENVSWYHIVWALLLAVMIWRMWPVAMSWMKDGPKGSGQDWMSAVMLLGGVVLFVVFLIMLVR